MFGEVIPDSAFGRCRPHRFLLLLSGEWLGLDAIADKTWQSSELQAYSSQVTSYTQLLVT